MYGRCGGFVIIVNLLFLLFGVRLLSGIFRKKHLNARDFAWEYIRSCLGYGPGQSVKRRGKSSSLHSKKYFFLGCAGCL